MKQYLNEQQTAKLIELGFAEPKGYFCKVVRGETPFQDRFTFDCNYSIGELIEMLPKEINDALPNRLELYIDHNKMWVVEYNNALGELLSTCRTELIDALYDMSIKLKEEGVV